MLGRALMKIARKQGYLARGTYHDSFPSEKEREDYLHLDLLKTDSILESVLSVQPHFVIHTAALTNVDRCETEKELAWRLNVKATADLAKAAAKAQSRLVYISADYVFDGKIGNYTEADDPNPINYYGETKLEAEFSIRKILADPIIIRTSIHGWKDQSHSFSSWILNELKKRNRVHGIVDQITSVMYAGCLAKAILTLMTRPFSGTLHIASRDKASKFEFAHLVAKVFRLNEDLVIPAKAEEMVHWKASRPKDVSLCVTRAEDILGYSLPSILEGLQRMKLDAQ